MRVILSLEVRNAAAPLLTMRVVVRETTMDCFVWLAPSSL
jgi:hypothetical protein